MKASNNQQDGASAASPPEGTSGQAAPTPPPPNISNITPPPATPRAEPASPAPAPEAGLADIEWMPQPTEDRVARFLSNVAEMGPSQPQEREVSMPPAFLPPLSVSPEEAERKKARAEPFLSQVRATPMASPPRARTLKRWRRRLIWLLVIALLLLLALIAGRLAFPHVSFLHFSLITPNSTKRQGWGVPPTFQPAHGGENQCRCCQALLAHNASD